MQWPCPVENHPGTARRYTDNIFPTASGRAQFLPRPYRPPREQVDHEFPLVLTTGRIGSQWHSRTRTGKVAKLAKREPEPFLGMHPDDAVHRHIETGDIILVSSRRGWIRVAARVSASVREGMVFMPFHWGDLFGKQTAANYLTNPVIGRIAKEPEFKYCTVQVEKVPQGESVHA